MVSVLLSFSFVGSSSGATKSYEGACRCLCFVLAENDFVVVKSLNEEEVAHKDLVAKDERSHSLCAHAGHCQTFAIPRDSHVFGFY